MAEEHAESAAEMKYSSKMNWKIALPTAAMALFLLFVSLLPTAIEYGAERWLNEHGIEEAKIENIDLNLFTGEFLLQGLKAGDGLNIERLSLNFDWLPLFGQVIHLRSFSLDSANIDLHQNEQRLWQLADIKFDSPEVAGGSDAAEAEIQTEAWTAVVDGLQVKALQLNVNAQEMQLMLPVDALQLTLSPLQDREQRLDAELKLGETDFIGFGYQVNNRSVDLNATLLFSILAEDIAASLRSEGSRLNVAGLKLAREGGEALATVGSMDLNGVRIDGLTRERAESINISEVSLQPLLTGTGALKFETVDIEKFDADLNNQISFASLLLRQLQADGMGGGDERLQLKRVELADLNMVPGKTVNLKHLIMQGFDLKQARGRQLLAAVESISLKALTMTDADHGQFESLVLNNIQLPTVGEQSLGSIGSVVASGATLDINGVYQLKRLQFNELNSGLRKQKNGKLQVVDELTAYEQVKQKEKRPGKRNGGSSSEMKKGSQEPLVIIDELLISRGSKIVYRDESVSPALDARIDVEKFRIAPLDMSGKRVGSVDIVMGIGKDGELSAKGNIRPYVKQLKTDLVVSLKDFDLTGLSGFVETDFGKSISTGEFNLNSDINISGNRIQANNRLLVRQLKLGEPSRLDEKPKSPGVPIEMALSLIRDKQGNINLQVPVQGALDNPDVKMRVIFNRALKNSLSSSAIASAARILKPYGTITLKEDVADGSIRHGKAMLTPVLYGERISKLTPKMRDYVSKIAQLLKQNDFMLSVCGVATRLEGAAISAQEVKESGGLKQVRLAMGDEKLLKLAALRSDIIITTVKAHGIAVDRISRCGSQIDASQAQPEPRVELILN